MKTKTHAAALILVIFCCWLSPAHADGESEFLLFVSADYLERGSVGDPDVQKSDFTPTIDLLYSYSNGPWRVLGEYFLTDDENELERLQIGYDYSETGTLWFGRFHQPISAWNHRYHHGAYLQPSISRPSIENWEDENGVMPAHVTGVMLSAWQPIGDSNGFRYTASIGLAPILVDGELLPFDILDPDDGGNLPAGTINIAYFPDYVGESNIGVIAGYAEIEARPNPIFGIDSSLEIRQTVFGAQLNWDKGDWQLISAAYYIDNETSGTGLDVGGRFISGYAQALRTLSANTRGYVRLERSNNAADAAYLRLFPLYVWQKDLIGFRYDFATRQAINIEVSTNKIASDDYREVRAQWSAAFP